MCLYRYFYLNRISIKQIAVYFNWKNIVVCEIRKCNVFVFDLAELYLIQNVYLDPILVTGETAQHTTDLNLPS